ncbi:chromatin accessibility complex 1-like [Lecanosticta acicola]|uniref:Chromatin accessibility complex 1-like n=1 Tax=Lecanosticta acicola TaxID=111012 RepID=A0AAI8Z0S6_9PEZI|nr:chromatin accessibility complex 1-like [Lecanosticta acicola]
MPYNNTPITPSKEVTGTVALPLARVKKIVSADPDVGNCSNNAAFVITVATEMFLQHLVEQAYTQVRTENTQKPRRNIQYRDVANAVARVENLEFLSDVVPKTTTFKQHKQKVAKEAAAAATTSNSQGPMDGHLGGKERATSNGGPSDLMEVDSPDESEEGQQAD